jgi:ligand-binding sensor domain-containing protein
MKKRGFKYYVLFLSICLSSLINAQTVIGNYEFNGIVHAIVQAPNGSTYLGGDFTKVGSYAGSGVIMDTSTGAWNQADVKIEGKVFCSVAIPIAFGGGWYIGGEFTTIDGQVRNRLARINADGSLHPFNPNMNFAVNALVIDANGNLYAGGLFTTVGGSVTRNRLAKFDASGVLTSFNPSFTGGSSSAVNALVFDANGNLFVGGDFTTIGGSTIRNRLAKFNSTGILTSFNPNFSWTVLALAFDNAGNLYVGGNFLTVNGLSYSRLVKFDAAGVLTNFSPVPNDAVMALTVDTSGSVYAGGFFTSIGGVNRNRIAKFDASGNLSSFNPFTTSMLNDVVYDLAIDAAGNLYVGGEIGLVGAATRNNLAKFNHLGVLMGFNPNMNGYVRTLALNVSGQMFVGGNFTTIGPVSTRNHLAKLNAAGLLASFNPNMNKSVRALVRDTSGNIYAGGEFVTVGGATRARVAKFNQNDVLTSFNPDIGYDVNALALDANGNLYVGGDFTSIGGVTRNRVAKFDHTGILTSFNPDFNYEVHALAVDANGNLYVGGSFSSVGGSITRNKLAKFDSAGVLTSFNPNLNSIVYDLALDANGNLYVGGNFNTVGGTVTRNYLAKFDAAGNLTGFNPNFNSIIRTLAVDANGNLYAGGYFTTVDNVSRLRLAKFDSTGSLTNFSPNMANCVVELAVDPSGNLHAGGCFPTGYAFFCFTPPTITSSVSGAACGAGSVTLQATASNGASVKWYADSVGGSLLHTGSTFTTPVISATTTFYAEAISAGCISNTRTPVVATIGTTTPNAPSGAVNQTFCDVATVSDLSATGLEIKWYDAPTAGNLLSVTDTLITATQYFATQTVNGCESANRLSVSVTINSSVSGIDSIAACNSFTWIDGNTYTSNNNSATYNFLGGAVNGCDSLVILHLTIDTVNVSVTNNSPLLTSNAVGATYQWLDCTNGYAQISGETGISFTATANGSYAVEVSQHGCTDTSVCLAVTNIGIKGYQVNTYEITVYPNPSSGIFTVDYTFNEPIEVEVFTIHGKLISKTQLTQKSNSINLSDQPAGIYLMNIYVDNSLISTRKIIMQ